MKLLALLLAVGPIATGPGTEYFAGMPPERFQGEIVTKLIVTAPERLAEACGIKLPDPTPEQQFTIYGCSYRTLAGQPVVVIPNPCLMGGYEETATILCHEIAHLRGWSGKHPL